MIYQVHNDILRGNVKDIEEQNLLSLQKIQNRKTIKTYFILSSTNKKV